MSKQNFPVLLHILTSEQELLKRTDQKASTLMSTLGLFMVFFIVHYHKLPTTPVARVCVYLYFVAALVTLFLLLRVLSPRTKNTEIQSANQTKIPNPTFFAGIADFKTKEDYRANLAQTVENEEYCYQLFADNLYAIGNINAQKFKYYTLGMKAFGAAIFFELLVMISMYAKIL